jgi:Mg2+ and Co2+ transporter CorA
MRLRYPTWQLRKRCSFATPRRGITTFVLQVTVFGPRSAEDVDTLEEGVSRIRRNHLLWVDAKHTDDGELAAIAETLEITEGARARLDHGERPPGIVDDPTYLHVTTCVPASGDELLQVDCLVGEDWLVTIHDGTPESIDDFRERVTGRGNLGTLDAPSFLATLFEWVVDGYLAAFDRIEDELEDMDVKAMRATDAQVDEALNDLLEIRRRTGRLRRALAAHREVFGALAHPEFDAVSSKDSAERFQSLVDRLDRAVGVAQSVRDSILGSFDVLIARAGQRTNEIMKVLTLTSVLLLPAAALAGVMGMNFKVGLFTHDELFWAVIAVMVLIGAGTLAVARVRRWI